MRSLVVAMSAVVSGRSAWLLLGFTGMAYSLGLSAVWAVAGYTIAEFLLFFWYAPRIRRFSEAYDCITIPDFFSERFQDKKNILRLIVSVIIILFMVSYVSAQFVAGGKAFQASFGISYHQGLLLTSGIILFYTLLGGFLAVSITDTIQAFFMLIALIILPIMAIYDLGGWYNFISMLNEIDNGSFVSAFSISIAAIIGFLGIGLGSAGNPHIVARYMSLKDVKKTPQVALTGTITNIVLACGALLSGLAGRIYFPLAEMLPSGDTENLYASLAFGHLHPILFGVVIASIFAAIMSTADSQLLVASSAIVRDIYEKIIIRKKPILPGKMVALSRLVVFILVIISTALSSVAENLIFWLVLFAWAGLGATFGPTSILALFWEKTTLKGILAGILSGSFTVIIWYYIPVLKSFVYELVPAFFVSIIVTIVVSLFTKKPQDTEVMFEKMNGILPENISEKH